MIANIDELLKRAKEGDKIKIAVACAHDSDVLKAVSMAAAEGLAEPILVGKAEEIKRLLAAIAPGVKFEIINADTDIDAAQKSVELVKTKKAGFLMKGLLSTSDMMRAVIDKEKGLRTDSLISHVMAYDSPEYEKLLFLTDGGMNTFPTLEKKVSILENAGDVLKALGYREIFAACICGSEEVSEKIVSTTDAKALSEMTDRFAKFNMTVAGPMGLDLAISKESCRHKKYTNPVGGAADILLVPTYEVGNGIGKALTYFGKAKSAGIIVGAAVPIVLVSRADTAETKLASIAFGAVVSQNKNNKG